MKKERRIKRRHKDVRRKILRVLSDKEWHSFGNLERKVNTNWLTIRIHCKDLELFEVVEISIDNKVKITEHGLKIFNKIQNTND